MIKIIDAVEDIINSSEIARSALGAGYLNMTSYARKIKREVEVKTKKPVRVGSIVVALSRIRYSLKRSGPLLPEVFVEDLSVRSGLVELAYNRTKENLITLKNLYRGKATFSPADFLLVSQGTGEITIVATERAQEKIICLFRPAKPKIIMQNLAGLTVRFNEDYIKTPNVIYSFVRRLAIKRINVVEIISTYTELTFILHEEDFEKALVTLNKAFQKN